MRGEVQRLEARVAPERRSVQSSHSNDCGRVCRVSSLSEETANRENSKSAWLWLVGCSLIYEYGCPRSSLPVQEPVLWLLDFKNVQERSKQEHPLLSLFTGSYGCAGTAMRGEFQRLEMRVTSERRSIQSSYSNDCGGVCRVSSLLESEETANRENSN